MTTPPARATCATPGCAGDIVRERLGDGSTRWVHLHTGAELCWPGSTDVAAPAVAPVHQRAAGAVERKPGKASTNYKQMHRRRARGRRR